MSYLNITLLAVYVFFVNISYAQKLKAYPVKAGEIPGEVLPNEAIYVLPAFTVGTVLFRNGTSSTVPFNYNYLLDEMHFINEKGDTLAIADPLLISSVIIDSMVFYYDKGYVREILKQGVYKLAVRQQMEQIRYKTRGGYDTPSELASIKTYGSVGGVNSQIYNLQIQKDVLFQQSISFYIADASNHFLKASKKNFYTFFPAKKVTDYLEEYTVNFNKEGDLEGLLRYCVE